MNNTQDDDLLKDVESRNAKQGVIVLDGSREHGMKNASNIPEDRVYIVPANYRDISRKEIADFGVYKMNPSCPVEDEWNSLCNIVANIMVEELNGYSGREQQKKGVVMQNTQTRVFGETLPRGHGHKGRLSAYMSLMFDEITGRTPRRRRAKRIIAPTEMEIKQKHAAITPLNLSIGVIGEDNVAKVIIQRLRQCNYMVVSPSRAILNEIYSDAVNGINESIPSIQYISSIRDMCSMVELIIVANSPEKAELFYFGDSTFFDMLKPKQTILDVTIDSISLCSQLHETAKKRNVSFFDCPLFPAPTSLLSYSVSPPSVFLGGDAPISEFAMSVIYSIGASVFSCKPDYGVIYRIIASYYYAMENQVLAEISQISTSLQLFDEKALGQIIRVCADPQSLLLRNHLYEKKEPKERDAQTITLHQLYGPIRQLFNLPSPQLPYASLASKIAGNAERVYGMNSDISILWKPQQYAQEQTRGEMIPHSVENDPNL